MELGRRRAREVVVEGRCVRLEVGVRLVETLHGVSLLLWFYKKVMSVLFVAAAGLVSW